MKKKINTQHTHPTTNGKCPFSRFVSSLNKLSDHNRKKLPSIKHIISILRDPLQQETITTIENIEIKWYDHQDITKIKTHIYATLFLQSEAYTIIQQSLNIKTNPELYKIGLKASHSDLHDPLFRWEYWSLLLSAFQWLAIEFINKRDKEKFQNLLFQSEILKYPLQHWMNTNFSIDTTFSKLFIAGIGDGFLNYRSIINKLPDLYERKYNKYPSKEEYRHILQKSIKNIIVPIVSINMEHLIDIVRMKSHEQIQAIQRKDYSEYKHLLEAFWNTLGIDNDNFELDDENNIIIKQHYLQKVEEKLQIMEKKYSISRQYLWDTALSNTLGHRFIRTGCPALRGHIGEKRIIEIFCEDILSLLDHIYFPYRRD